MRWLLWSVLILVLIVVAVPLGVWLSLRAPDIPQAELEARYTDRTSHFADLAGGVRLHYKDEGRGPVFVLVHGGGDNLWTWDGWVKTLKNRYRIIRVDLPGHGLTQVPAGMRVDLDGDAALIAELSDRLHLTKLAIAGNSLGGSVSVIFAEAHPEKLRALILLDAAGFPNHPSLQKPPLAFRLLQYKFAREVLKTIDNKPLIVDALKKEVGNSAVVTDEIVNRWAELQRAPGHRDILLGGALVPKYFADSDLREIHVPTLVLWGNVDPVVEAASGQRFAALVPGAKLIVYPHVGHLPQIEIPGTSAEDTAKFLSDLD